MNPELQTGSQRKPDFEFYREGDRRHVWRNWKAHPRHGNHGITVGYMVDHAQHGRPPCLLVQFDHEANIVTIRPDRLLLGPSVLEVMPMNANDVPKKDKQPADKIHSDDGRYSQKPKTDKKGNWGKHSDKERTGDEGKKWKWPWSKPKEDEQAQSNIGTA